jgi:hypothetical protein
MINGGIKFFKRSKCLFADGTVIAASSNNSSAPQALDRNPITFWRGSSADDTVLETLTITFMGDQTINRLLLVDHNFKDFNIKYDLAGVWTDFSGVVGIDGSLANITQTSFADDTAYYEFTPVTTGLIKIEVLKTQTPDQKKYINQIIATEEIGTLNGFPKIKGTEINRNIRKKNVLSGKTLVQKSEESFEVEVEFDNYPAGAPYNVDTDLIFSLHDLEVTFLIWLCGGRRGANYFRKQMRGYRLRDVFNVQIVAAMKPVYSNNIYQGGINFSAKFEEAID